MPAGRAVPGPGYEIGVQKATKGLNVITKAGVDASEGKQTCGKWPEDFSPSPRMKIYTALWCSGRHLTLIPPCRTPGLQDIQLLSLSSLTSERTIQSTQMLLLSPRKAMMSLL